MILGKSKLSTTIIVNMTRSSLVAALTLALVLTATVLPVSAHFTLTGSREGVAFPSDNRRFWPIAGGGVLRPVLDCLQFPPNSSPRTLQAGSSVRLPFEIGNGARHVGLCQATLINRDTGATTSLGSQPDCVNRQDAMDVQIPATATCTNCVIKVKVVATHLGAAFPEDYDSCLDVSVTGGTGGGSPVPPTVPTPPSAAPVPTRTQGDGGRRQDDAPAAPARPTSTAPVATPPTPTAAPLQPGAGTGKCTLGDMRCAGLAEFEQCDPAQRFVKLRVPAGTVCKTAADGTMFFGLA